MKQNELINLKNYILNICKEKQKKIVISNREKRIYAVNGEYFYSKSEIIKYCNEKRINKENIFIIDYIRSFNNKKDIFCVINHKKNRILYSVVDIEGYLKLDYNKALETNNISWTYCFGSIEELYGAFRKIGIKFENDIYEEENKKMNEFLTYYSQLIVNKKK